MFGVESASPNMKISSDGYLGLGLDRRSTSMNLNTLDQLVSHKVIESKMFGVYTRNKNDSDMPSQIRFGGYNSDLLKENE